MVGEILLLTCRVGGMALKSDVGGAGSRQVRQGHADRRPVLSHSEEGGEAGLPVEGLQARREQRVRCRVMGLHVPPADHLWLDRVHAGGARALAAGRIAGTVLASTVRGLLQGLAQQALVPVPCVIFIILAVEFDVVVVVAAAVTVVADGGPGQLPAVVAGMIRGGLAAGQGRGERAVGGGVMAGSLQQRRVVVQLTAVLGVLADRRRYWGLERRIIINYKLQVNFTWWFLILCLSRQYERYCNS